MEHLHEVPNRVKYGPFYVVEQYDIEEMIAFLEIREDQRREREETR